MNWMLVLYWVLGIIGYILMGGLVVWIARKVDRWNDFAELENSTLPHTLKAVLIPGVEMGLLWPLTVLCVILFFVLVALKLVEITLNGYRNNRYRDPVISFFKKGNKT